MTQMDQTVYLWHFACDPSQGVNLYARYHIAQPSHVAHNGVFDQSYAHNSQCRENLMYTHTLEMATISW